MKKLWLAFIVVATLGSVYPFDFQLSGLDVESLREFVQSCCRLSSRGDIVGNIILFLPFGFTGMFAAPVESSARRRLTLVCVIGAIFAFALQVMQLYLPSRDANLQDVVWNTFGAAGGAMLAIVVHRYSTPTAGRIGHASLVPLTLVGSWLVYRLIPFVPSLDFQSLKDSVKPLLSAQLVPVSIVRDCVAWVVVAYLLRQARRDVRLDAYLPALMIAVFFLEVLIVENAVDASDVLGSVLALIIWFVVLHNLQRPEGLLVVLLGCTLVLTGVAPFVARIDPVQLTWLPFHGFLDGSMYINAQSAAEKVFLYGSLVYLLRQLSFKNIASIVIAFSIVASIEFAQTRFVGHTPEITDPLLVIFAALTLLALERQETGRALVRRTGSTPPAVPKRMSAETSRRPRRRSPAWVKQRVNLRKSQLVFLQQLSKEMGVSVSRVTRHIVTDFIEGLESSSESSSEMASIATVNRSDETGTIRTLSSLRLGDWTNGWVTETVNLRRDQFEFLLRLSHEMDATVSRVTRRIVANFMEKVDEEQFDEEQLDGKVEPDGGR